MTILRFRAGCGAILASALLSQSVAAQSLHDWQSEGQSELRATASITIPLGGRHSDNETRPRVDFALASTYHRSEEESFRLHLDHDYEPRTLQMTRLSFTLEDNPELSINGQRVATFGPRLTADEDEDGGGLGTAGWIVLGAGAVLGMGYAFAKGLENELEEAFRFDD